MNQTVWGTLIRELIDSLRADIWYAVMYKKVTKREIADRASVHVTTLHAFLNEEPSCNPTVKTLMALSQALSEVD